MRSLSIAVALSIASPAWADSQNDCGTYPKGVATGYSDCVLQKVGEKPLWRDGLKRGVLQEVRFTFTEGHLAYTKIIHVIQRASGRASVSLQTIRRERDGEMTISMEMNRHLSRQEIETIDQLGSSSGTWEQRIGSWDGDELFVHCETLDLERVTSAGYSFASVNISCNQPKRLMPLVNFVTALVNLKPYADRKMF